MDGECEQPGSPENMRETDVWPEVQLEDMNSDFQGFLEDSRVFEEVSPDPYGGQDDIYMDTGESDPLFF